MTVVVTGGSGFVGRNLIGKLLEQGRAVRVPIFADSERRHLEGLDVDIIKADVRDQASLDPVFDGAKTVYHLAGMISLQKNQWADVEAVNVRGTENVVNACMKAGVQRLVHFSSFHALVQEPLHIPLTEDSALVDSRKYPPYNWSKAMGELAVWNAIDNGLDAVIVCPTGIIGPNDLGPSYFGRTLMNLVTGKFPALVHGGCDWVDVRDVVDGALAAEAKAPTGAKYLLSGSWATITDIAGMIAELAGVSVPKLTVPMWVARLMAPISATAVKLVGKIPLFTPVSLEELRGNPNVSHERAKRELGYNPRPLSQTIKDTLQWFVDSGKLDVTLRA